MGVWRDGSALKLTCCPSSWPKFNSQHPYWRLTIACSSSSRVLESASGFDGHTTTNLYIHRYIKNKNKTSFKKKRCHFESREWTLPDTKPGWSWTFQPPEYWEVKFCCLYKAMSQGFYHRGINTRRHCLSEYSSVMAEPLVESRDFPFWPSTLHYTWFGKVWCYRPSYTPC